MGGGGGRGFRGLLPGRLCGLFFSFLVSQIPSNELGTPTILGFPAKIVSLPNTASSMTCGGAITIPI